MLTCKSTHNVLEINDVSKIYTLNERYLHRKSILLFALESILDLVIFSMKTGNFLKPPKGKYLR